MSNQTFLYTTATSEKPLHGKCPEEGNLLMAAMSIPFFWYALFDEKCLTLGPGTSEGDMPYLHLTTPTQEGLTRAESRWPALGRVLGRKVAPLFQSWLSFIRAHAAAYVHCETAEWFWMFDNHDKFEKELRTCLAAFKHVPKASKSGLNLNKWWDTLLGQAHVGTRDGILQPLGNLSYCGFAHHYDVPWDDGNTAACGALKVVGNLAPMVGNEPGDVRKYLEAASARFGCVIDRFRLAECDCGSVIFQLLSNQDKDVASRVCVDCGVTHPICGCGEYWGDAKPIAWKCSRCDSTHANLGVGFLLDDRERSVLVVTIGQRCVKCGLMDDGIGWETFGASLKLMDDV